MRAVRFRVSASLLEQALNMPATSTLVDCRWDGREVEFVVMDPSLPEVEEPQDCQPFVTREKVKWNWGIDGTTDGDWPDPSRSSR